MARLPVDIAELSNRNELPTGAMSVQQATARNAGGQVGAALSGLGDAVQGLALKIEENKRQSTGFDIEQQFIRLQEEEARGYEERTRGLAGSGDGHWEASRAATAETFNEWVDGLPEWAQDEYRTKAERITAERSNRAFQDQYTQQDNNSRAVLSEEERKAGLGVQEDPETFEAFRQRQHELIDKSTLPAAEKEKLKRETDAALAVTAAESDAMNNPGDALAASSEPQGDWLKYSNQSATRNDPLDARLVSAMSFVADMGITMDVISGGQESNKPGEGTGSTRHNHGNSADVDFYKDGRKLDWNNPADLPILKEIVAKAKGRGVTGIGAGDDYMGPGRFHVGFGAPAVWGKDGKSENAPAWLVDAYNGATAGTLPSAEEAAAYAAQPAYMEYLNADQKAAYYRTAERAFQGEVDAAQAVADAQRKASQDAAMLAILEGPDPQGAYDTARKDGLIGSFEEVKKADAVLADRQKKDEETTRGIDLMNGSIPADRMSADDRKAVDYAFNSAVKAGVSVEDAAGMAFDKTGIVPPSFAKGLISGAQSNDPARIEQSLVATANLLNADANAFNGVDNSENLRLDGQEFIRRTEVLGQSSEDAVKAILADRARPALVGEAQKAALETFRKDTLTPEAVEAGLATAAGAWSVGYGVGSSGATVPVGEETGGDAMRSIYRGLAEEGFRKFGDADRAMSYAATEVGRRFGVFNGVLTQYPPDKAGVPALPNSDDPYAWVAEQAAAAASEEFGLELGASSVVLVPIEDRGVSTRAAFGGKPMPIPGAGGKASVPYSIVVVPEDGSPAMVVPGVFLPDINDYVKTKNAEAAPVVDPGVMGYGAVETPFTPLSTPGEAQAAKDAELRAARTAGLAAEASDAQQRGGVKATIKGPGARNQDF